MTVRAIALVLLLAGDASAFALAPATALRPAECRTQQPRMALELLHDHTTMSELSQQLAGVIPGLPGYADDPNFVGGNDWNGGVSSRTSATPPARSLRSPGRPPRTSSCAYG